MAHAKNTAILPCFCVIRCLAVLCTASILFFVPPALRAGPPRKGGLMPFGECFVYMIDVHTMIDGFFARMQCKGTKKNAK